MSSWWGVRLQVGCGTRLDLRKTILQMVVDFPRHREASRLATIRVVDDADSDSARMPAFAARGNVPCEMYSTGCGKIGSTKSQGAGRQIRRCLVGSLFKLKVILRGASACIISFAAAHDFGFGRILRNCPRIDRLRERASRALVARIRAFVVDDVASARVFLHAGSFTIFKRS